MTKEELKQEAEAEADKVIIGSGMDRTSVIHLKHLLATMYIQGVEPREKQIQIDAEQIRALQKQNGELTDKVKELEAQIEKMKCCYNCSKDCGSIDRRICFENKMKDWELKK